MMLVATHVHARRVQSVLLSLILLAPSVVTLTAATVLVAPTAEAQGGLVPCTGVPPPDYRIDDFTVGYAAKQMDTWVTNETALTVWVSLTNAGGCHAEDVALLAYARDGSGDTVDEAVACKVVNLGRGVTESEHTLTIRLPARATEADSQWTVRVAVNHLPSDWPDGYITNPDCVNSSNPTPNTETESTVGAGTTDNVAQHVVISDRRLNLRVKEFVVCRGDSAAGQCLVPGSATDAYSVTQQLSGQRSFKIRFTVDNYQATYNADNPNPSPTDSRWDYRAVVKAISNSTGEVVFVNDVVRNLTLGGAGEEVLFDLHERAGDYNFTIEIDPANQFPETQEGDNSAYKEARVKAAELVPAIGGEILNHTRDEPLTYGSNHVATVTYNLTAFNAGDYIARNSSESFVWNVYLDKVDSHSDYFIYTRSTRELAAGAYSRTNVLSFKGYDPAEATNPPSDAKPLAPGEHKLIFVLDAPCGGANCSTRGRVVEEDETNNQSVVTFYVKDDRKPEVVNFTAIPEDPDPAVYEGPEYEPKDAAVDLTVNKTQKVSWRVKVTDDDTNLAIRLFHQPPTGNATNVSISEWTNGTRWTHVLNSTYKEVGVHNIWVEATDSGGNTGTSAKFQLRVKPWEIQTLLESEIVTKDIANDSSYSYREDGAFILKVEVNATETGLYPEMRDDNKRYKIWFPGDEQPTEDTMSSLADCPEPGVIPLPGEGECSNTNLFQIALDGSHVGMYRLSMRIRDAAGDERVINRTWNVTGSPPTIVSTSPLPESVDAGETIVNVTAEVTDQFGVDKVFVNFSSKSSSYYHNVTIDKPSNGTAFYGNWTTNVTTGFDRMVTHGGAFNVTFAAVNVNGNWSTSVSSMNITDTQAPKLLDPSVKPNPQELNLNVTFSASATDHTALRVRLVIKKGDSQQIAAVDMVRNGTTNNYAYTRSFAEAGAYTYLIEAIDSMGFKSTPHNGQFSIEANLPPRVELTSPGYMKAGEHYSNANPVIQFTIEDGDGLDLETLVTTAHIIRPAQDPVPFPLSEPTTRAGANPRETIVTYTPSLGAPPLAHGSTVGLKLIVNDTTGRVAEHDSQFRVDTRAPKSADEPGFSGHTYREFDTDYLNVSLDAVLRFTASDDDATLSTAVKTIEFNVIGVATSDKFVYAEHVHVTLRDVLATIFNDAEPSSGLYTIQYWATDAVDNRESPKRFDVHVDASPPRPDTFRTPKQGKFINATWRDDESGISRAVAYYNLNGGLFKILELKGTPGAAGVWSGIIDEGRKGDTVCYYLQAWDRVENTFVLGSQEQAYHCYPVGNALPSVHIDEPGNEATVQGRVRIAWSATDPDEEPLKFSVYYKLVGTANPRDLARDLEGVSSYSFDSTLLGDGTYEFIVQATDGTLVGFASVVLRIQNNVVPILNPTLGKTQIRPGEDLVITAEVLKAGANVTAVIFLDEKVHLEVPMHDDGKDGDEIASDGIYTAVVRDLRESGKYTVEIWATYPEDGVDKTDKLRADSAFTVKFTAADVFTTYASIWAALVVLVVACAGVGGYALLRKWRT